MAIKKTHDGHSRACNFLNCHLKVPIMGCYPNKLSLNVNKTYYLIFHRARIKVDNDNSIRMNDSIINSPSQLKYIGLIIDSKVNWIPHITYVKNKISKGIGIMFKARDYLNKNLYHIYIFPYLIYCIEVWGNASHCHLLSLFLTQKKKLFG